MDNPEAGSTPRQAAAGGGSPGDGVRPAYPDHPGPAPVPPVYRPTNGLAVAAFVTGLVGLFSCPLLGGVAVYLATRARTDIRATGESGDSLALAGLIVGWCGLAIGVLVALLWALLMAAFIAINAGHGPG